MLGFFRELKKREKAWRGKEETTGSVSPRRIATRGRGSQPFFLLLFFLLFNEWSWPCFFFLSLLSNETLWKPCHAFFVAWFYVCMVFPFFLLALCIEFHLMWWDIWKKKRVMVITLWCNIFPFGFLIGLICFLSFLSIL